MGKNSAKGKIEVQPTEPDFMVGGFDAVCEYVTSCDLCGDEFSWQTDAISSEDESNASAAIYKAGWRNVSYPGHVGVVCMLCVRAGFVENIE